MKYLFPILSFAVLVVAACGEKKPETHMQPRPAFTGEPGKDIVRLLPIGPVTVERMDGMSRNARMSQ
eukprot:gene10780-13691_t